MEVKKRLSKLVAGLGRYKYAALVLLLGITLLCLPNRKTEDCSESLPAQPDETSQPQLEQQLESILSGMSGAGQVRVLLTISAGERTLYQSDEDTTVTDSQSSLRKDTLVITDADRAEKPVAIQIIPPVYAGAVILCQGADRAEVRLAIVEAVSKATGLSTDKICVLKMK